MMYPVVAWQRTPGRQHDAPAPANVQPLDHNHVLLQIAGCTYAFDAISLTAAVTRAIGDARRQPIAA
jgi:hypothetical protein